MTAATAPHPSPSDPQADLRAEDALYYRRVLHGLIDRGADLARAVHENGSVVINAPDLPTPTPVPEPASLALLGMGLAGLLGLRRRV